MNIQLKKIRNTIMVILTAFGIGILILVQVIERNNLTEWREPLTHTLWIYLGLVWFFILFLNAIPLIWNHFKKNKLEFPKED